MRRGPRTGHQLGRVDSDERLLAALARDPRDRAVPRSALRRVGRRPPPAVVPVMGVDSVLLAEAADLVDRVGRRVREPECLDAPTGELERREVMPEAEGEAAVRTARHAGT